MSDISETTELGEGYDQPNEAVEEAVSEGEHAVDHGEHGAHGEHWSDLKYVYLALALAAITAIEVALSYSIDFWGPAFLPLLIALMIIKFFSVVMFFMHLKFDNRLFSVMFYMGLGLAVVVYVIALFTFRFFSS